MIIREFKKIFINSATWEDVVLALTPDYEALAPGYSNAPENWKELVSGMGLNPDTVLLSATHSLSNREVEFLNGTQTYFLPDPQFPEQGWHVITEDNLCRALWDNGDERIKVHSMEDGSFRITGSFPIEDGEMFKGNYYYSMMSPVRRFEAKENFKKMINHRAANFGCALLEVFEHSGICNLDGFQEWELDPVDPAPFVALLQGMTELTVEEAEIMIDGVTVKALVLVPAEGWGSNYTNDRDVMLGENPGLDLPELDRLHCGICRVA